MRWSADGNWVGIVDLAIRIPDQSHRRRESRQYQHRQRPSGRHRPKLSAWPLRPPSNGSTPRRSPCSRSINFGNAGRNTVLGPGGLHTGFLDLQKNFRIKEGHELQFRWEAYNVLNHPVWGLPEHVSQQHQFRPHHFHQRQHAANAVRAQIRFLRMRSFDPSRDRKGAPFTHSDVVV